MCSIEIECRSENDVPIYYMYIAPLDNMELLEEMTLEGKWFLHYLRTIIKNDIIIYNTSVFILEIVRNKY